MGQEEAPHNEPATVRPKGTIVKLQEFAGA